MKEMRFWINGAETSRFWLGVLNELKAREWKMSSFSVWMGFQG